MVDKRVIETVFHSRCKGLQIFFIQRQRRDDLLMEHLVHEAADGLILHAVADNVEAGQVRARNKAGVGAV